MSRETGPGANGSTSWLQPWILQSLHNLERAMGETIGAVRTGQEATHRRIEDLRRELAGRLDRLERQVHRERRSPAVALEIARRLPWRHIITLAALVVLGLLGHIGPKDILGWLLGG